jgi:hypothetical protein
MFLEDVRMWLGVRMQNCFAYGMQSEACMERQLHDMTGRERQTTFMSDMSVAEWVGGLQGLLDTIRDILHAWINNEVYIAEFILCVNWKSWEHYARGNDNWAKVYSTLYHELYAIIMDYHEGDSEKTEYIWEYLD